MDDAVAQAVGLSKRFGRQVAVSNVDLVVPAGEFLALTGPNGAGKTTLLKLLLNLLRPDGGHSSILGCDSGSLSPTVLAQVGYVSEAQRWRRSLSVAAVLRYLRRLLASWDDELEQRLLGEFGLDPARRVGTLSRGEAAKLRMLGAIAYRPKLLIVDELFSGLDALTRDQLTESMIELTRQSGWTVLLTSHEMTELETLVDRVAFLNNGSLLLNERIDTLLARHRRVSVRSERNAIDVSHLPVDWRLDAHAGAHTEFLVSAYTSDATERKFAELFGSEAHIGVRALSLRDIFIEYAKQSESVRREEAA